MKSLATSFVSFLLLQLFNRGRCQIPGVIGTNGGNSANRNCEFPFIYQGVTYNYCITLHNKDVPWCATTDNYDIDKLWGRCVLTLSATKTFHGNANGANCAFPFIYRNIEYFTCTTTDNPTNRPWCATTSNYDIDGKWGRCIIYPLVQTTGGNVGSNSVCSFPFVYQGEEIYGCILEAPRGSWCSTTDNFDRDGIWGQCATSFVGCSNSYDIVENQLSYGGVDQADAQSISDCMQICDADTSCLGFDYDETNGISIRCYTHMNPNNFASKVPAAGVKQYILTNRCNGEMVTFGGNSGRNNAVCVFPYLYKGRMYTSCNSRNWYGPWCATTGNYDADGKWGECANLPTL